MRSVSLSIMLAAATTLSGCLWGKLPPRDHRQHNVAVANGLSVTLDIPNWEFTQGETFTATVTVKNLSYSPTTIKASTGAPVFIRLLRYTRLGWEEVLRYPRGEIMFMNHWTLGAREKKTFSLQLTVEPDWPIGDVVRMVAEVNGRAEPAPSIIIRVYAPGQTPAKQE